MMMKMEIAKSMIILMIVIVMMKKKKKLYLMRAETLLPVVKLG